MPKSMALQTLWISSEVLPLSLSLSLWLMAVTMQFYTGHKYIQLQDHENTIEDVEDTLLFPPEKVLKILILANLAMLIVNLINITGNWNKKSYEETLLSISEVIQLFPSKFTVSGEKMSTAEAQVIVELRTQIFFLLYWQLSEEENLARWNSEDRIPGILHVNVDRQSWEDKTVITLDP